MWFDPPATGLTADVFLVLESIVQISVENSGENTRFLVDVVYGVKGVQECSVGKVSDSLDVDYRDVSVLSSSFWILVVLRSDGRKCGRKLAICDLHSSFEYVFSNFQAVEFSYGSKIPFLALGLIFTFDVFDRFLEFVRSENVFHGFRTEKAKCEQGVEDGTELCCRFPVKVSSNESWAVGIRYVFDNIVKVHGRVCACESKSDELWFKLADSDWKLYTHKRIWKSGNNFKMNDSEEGKVCIRIYLGCG